jgi:hypothetical protein
VVSFFLFAILQQTTRKRVSRVIGCRATDFDQACIKCRSNIPGSMGGFTGPARVNNQNFFLIEYIGKRNKKIPEKIIF